MKQHHLDHSPRQGLRLPAPAILAGLLLASLGAAGPIPALAQSAGAGTATVVVDNVVRESSDGAQPLAASGWLQPADTIRTGSGSAAMLAMEDGTELAVGPETALTLEDFVNEAAGSAGKFVLDMAAGAMRFATGGMSKSAYTIRTPSAVAAVRGTIFTLYVTPVGETYVAVEEGTLVIRNKRGTKFTVPAGASMFLNTKGEVDGALFDPLQGTDLSGLPKGDGPNAAVRAMDNLLQQPAALATPRALGLPTAIDQGAIDPATLPPFATKTPAYGKSKYGDKKDREQGGGY